MGKSKRGEKEHTREQRLIHENQKLKKQISSLRKQLSRIDLDRFSHVRDILDEHYAQEAEPTKSEILEKLKNEWKCHKCPDGHLEIMPFTKNNERWYYRRCSNFPGCENRTVSQPYTPAVKGIVKEPVKPDR